MFLSHIEMFPIVSGDKVRLVQQLKFLLRDYEVDTVEITHKSKAKPADFFLPEIRMSKMFFIPAYRRYSNVLKTLCNDLPKMVNHYFHKEVMAYVGSVADRYDVVFCGSPAMASYVLRSNCRSKVLDMTDSLSMNYANAAATACFPFNLLYRVDSRRMLEYERRCGDLFDKVAYISEIDRSYVGNQNGKSVIVGNAVTVPAICECNQYLEDNHTISFVGMMRYRPNVQAASYLVKSLMPKVLKYYPDSLLNLVGANPTRKIKSYAGKNVVVTGYVDSLAPTYGECGLVVAPMLSGSGVQNKIIQAMAHGCCVVTTPMGAEGIPCGEDALVVRPPGKELNDAVIEYLGNHIKRRSVGEKAYECIVRTMSEEVVGKQFDKLMQV